MAHIGCNPVLAQERADSRERTLPECGNRRELSARRSAEGHRRRQGIFAGDGIRCDQEGCSNLATVTYRLKREYSRDNPYEWNRVISGDRLRAFCDKHKTRGDSGFDDSDQNYEVFAL